MTTIIEPTLKEKATRYKTVKEICIYKNNERSILLSIKQNRIKKTFCFVTPAQSGKGHHSRLSFETYEMALAFALKTLKHQSVNLSNISIEQVTSIIFIDDEIQKILEAEGIDVLKCKGLALEEHKKTVPIAQPQYKKIEPIAPPHNNHVIIKRPSIEELAASMRQISERI